MPQCNPIILRDASRQVLLDLKRRITFCQTQTFGDSAAVCINHDGRYPVYLTQDKIGNFSADTGKPLKSFLVRRNLSAEFIYYHLRGCNKCVSRSEERRV